MPHQQGGVLGLLDSQTPLVVFTHLDELFAQQTEGIHLRLVHDEASTLAIGDGGLSLLLAACSGGQTEDEVGLAVTSKGFTNQASKFGVTVSHSNSGKKRTGGIHTPHR